MNSRQLCRAAYEPDCSISHFWRIFVGLFYFACYWMTNLDTFTRIYNTNVSRTRICNILAMVSFLLIQVASCVFILESYIHTHTHTYLHICSICRRMFRCTTAHQCSSERTWIDKGPECSNRCSSGGHCLTLLVIVIYP